MSLHAFPWDLGRANRGHLVLVGYRGAGKSVVGRELARRLNKPFQDCDAWIVQHTGRTVAEWFAASGESAFRDQEEIALTQLLNLEPGVLALGGGVVERAINRDRIRAAGKVIWLQASSAALWQRIQLDETSGAGRPALTELEGMTEVETVLQRRTPLYAEIADLQVETQNRSVEQVVSYILERWV